MTRIAYFAQDLIGDALVWSNQLEALATRFAPCEVVVFCNAVLAGMFECMAYCDRVVVYDSAVPWGAGDAVALGHFDLVANTRYDADSIVRVKALDHEAAIGFENVDIPENICREVYNAYVPLATWDDYHLRRETSVTEQGMELMRLLEKDYHCERVSFGKTDFVREPPDGREEARIVFVVGASDPAKSWGLDNFLEVARFVHGRGFLPLFLLGPKEEEFGNRIREAGFAAAFNLSFRKIAGLFDPDYGTACVVGNDTGLMHLACALGAPSVTIMPYGSHFTWFPYAEDKRALHICCSPPCSHPLCLNECKEIPECAGRITTTDVTDAISRICTGGISSFSSTWPCGHDNAASAAERERQ